MIEKLGNMVLKSPWYGTGMVDTGDGYHNEEETLVDKEPVGRRWIPWCGRAHGNEGTGIVGRRGGYHAIEWKRPW